MNSIWKEKKSQKKEIWKLDSNWKWYGNSVCVEKKFKAFLIFFTNVKRWMECYLLRFCLFSISQCYHDLRKKNFMAKRYLFLKLGLFSLYNFRPKSKESEKNWKEKKKFNVKSYNNWMRRMESCVIVKIIRV